MKYETFSNNKRDNAFNNSNPNLEESLSKKDGSLKMITMTAATVVTMLFFIIAVTSSSRSENSSIISKIDLSQDFKSADSSKSSPSVKPNIVFILADDLGWNSIGYQDYDLTFTTPFLTNLAKKSVIMSNYYGQEICTPSRASLLTGRYPSSVGMQYGNVLEDGPWGMDLRETTLAEILRDKAQYTNYALGKWHLGHFTPEYLPTARGFHNYLGYLSGKNFYWSKNSPDYDTVKDFIYSDTECYNVYNGSDSEDYSTFVYRNKAIKTINEHDYDSGPMFLYFASQAVHDPFSDCSSGSFSTYDSGIPQDYVSYDIYSKIKESVVGEKRKQYAMSLYLLDQAVSAMYEALEKVNQLDNTYIIFASDNGACRYGGGKNAPLRGSKGTLFEGGTKVDAFIYSPLLPTKAKGTVYNGLMHVSDWLPTILDLADISYNPKKGFELDGFSHAKAFVSSDITLNKRTNMLYNMYTNIKYEPLHYLDINKNSSVAVRDTQYKLLHTYINNGYDSWFDYTQKLDDDGDLSEKPCSQTNSGPNYEFLLFDLINDPYEQTNLYQNDKYSSIKDSLEDLIKEYSQTTREVSYGTERSPEATSFWSEHGNFIQPWKKLDSSVLKKCDKTSSIYAP